MIEWMGRWQGRMHGWFEAGCDLLFPPVCACCGRELPAGRGEFSLCFLCEQQLGPEVWNGCGRCGSRLPEECVGAEQCAACRKTPLHFDTVIPLGEYDAELRGVVLRMKRPAHDSLSTAMGRLLASRRRVELSGIAADIVVPIPMFWTRRLRRGKNGPDLLARLLARSLGVPMRRRMLVRCRNTPLQRGVPSSRRFLNVRGAFRVRWPAWVQGARVLLVDDVLTTGATCSEAAKTLKRAGAAWVAVAVVARTHQAQNAAKSPIRKKFQVVATR